MQTPEFTLRWGFFVLFFFNLWSFFLSRSPQIFPSFFLLLCQLLPGNFSLSGGTGQGTRLPSVRLPAPSPSNPAGRPPCSPKGRTHRQNLGTSRPASRMSLNSPPITLGSGGNHRCDRPSLPTRLPEGYG